MAAKRLSDVELLQHFDAPTWAQQFVLTAKEHPEIVTDEGAMLGWFANALMRGWDEHARQHGCLRCRVLPPVEPAFTTRLDKPPVVRQTAAGESDHEQSPDTCPECGGYSKNSALCGPCLGIRATMTHKLPKEE